MNSSPSEELVMRAECARCAGLRKCDVKGHFCESGSDDFYHWSVDWRILQCRGCDYTFVQKIAENSEDYSHTEDGEIEYDQIATYWPALAKRKRPEWMSDWGIQSDGADKLDEVLLELYGALENDLIMLAAIGIRTAFDVASEILGADPGLSFQEKLKTLVDHGRIGITDQSRIELLVEAGNATAHRGWKPTLQNLVLMTEILEHFIHDAFVTPSRKAKLDAQAAKMGTDVPARQKPSRKKLPARDNPASKH